jgi:cell division protease FtsH
MASEKVIFGDFVDGNQEDLRRATQIAKSMVVRFGMSPSHNLRVYSGPMEETPISEVQLIKVDEAVNQILDNAYAKAYGIAQENIDLIKYLAEVLAEEKTLSFTKIKESINEFNTLARFTEHH